MDEETLIAFARRTQQAWLEKQSPAQIIQLVIDFLEAQPAGAAEGRRDDLLVRAKWLADLAKYDQASLKDVMDCAERARNAMASTLKQAAQPSEQETPALTYAQRRAAHRARRKAAGLCEEAGTGQPGPEVLIHGVPLERYMSTASDGVQDIDRLLKLRKMAKTRRAKDLRLGQTRIGGLPDLPPGQEWPTFHGKKIPFVAQLNLSEFPKAAHELLPVDGHLYAFALISNDEKHWPPPVAMFLWRGPAESLVRAARPRAREIWKDWMDTSVYELLPATPFPEGRDPAVRSNAEDGTHGYLFGEAASDMGSPGEVADERMQDGNDWMNLLCIMTCGTMEWSDAGELYLLIRRSALEKQDLSNVLAIVCSG